MISWLPEMRALHTLQFSGENFRAILDDVRGLRVDLNVLLPCRLRVQELDHLVRELVCGTGGVQAALVVGAKEDLPVLVFKQ